MTKKTRRCLFLLVSLFALTAPQVRAHQQDDGPAKTAISPQEIQEFYEHQDEPPADEDPALLCPEQGPCFWGDQRSEKDYGKQG